MLGIKAGDLLEICQNCPGCGTQHPCGDTACHHDFAFAIEDERLDGTVLARFFLIGDHLVSGNKIVVCKWGGWIPEEIEFLYDQWQREHGNWDEFDYRCNPIKNLPKEPRNPKGKQRKFCQKHGNVWTSHEKRCSQCQGYGLCLDCLQERSNNPYCVLCLVETGIKMQRNPDEDQLLEEYIKEKSNIIHTLYGFGKEMHQFTEAEIFDLTQRAADLEAKIAEILLSQGQTEEAVRNLISQASCLTSIKAFQEAKTIYQRALLLTKKKRLKTWIQEELQKLTQRRNPRKPSKEQWFDILLAGEWYRGTDAKGQGVGVAVLGAGLYLTWNPMTAEAFSKLAVQKSKKRPGKLMTYRVKPGLRILDSLSKEFFAAKKSLGVNPLDQVSSPRFAIALAITIKEMGYDGVIDDEAPVGLVLFDSANAIKIGEKKLL